MKKDTEFTLFLRARFRFVVLALGFLMSASAGAQLPTAQQISGKMKIGWNLGNMLEATWVPRNSYNNTTQTAIDSVKAAGFNTVRLPVAWFYHSDTITSKIDAAWLAHVKKIVDYCIKDSMYVIINAHWDKGWLENRVNTANKDIVNVRQQKYWTQIANYFKDYGDHLLFAGANEPNADDATEMAILLSYHQTFINAVRETGGKNSSRTLVIQGPSTDISNTDKYMKTLPKDQIENRLMVEVHYYTPWNFCGLNGDASWGKMFYYWGKGNHSTTEITRNATWGEESDMDKYLGMMKTKFIDKGIPVIIGEYGAFRRKLSPPSDQALHNASIISYYRYFVNSATKKGMITYCWDTGGIFNFTTGKINDRDVLNAIMQGAKDATTGIANSIGNEMEIYPNPFKTEINLSISNPEEVNRIEIYDLLGKQVETIGKPVIKSSMVIGSSLQPGAYIAQVHGNKGTRSYKIVKI